MAIDLSNRLIRSWIDSQGLAAPEPNRLHLLGIRSATPLAPRTITRVNPQPDHYDDCICVFGTELEAFAGSVDPGLAYTKAPLNPGGCAHICDGGPYKPYRMGKHKSHPAVVQGSALVRYWRDKDRDNKQDPTENPQVSGGLGLNFHAGGLEIVGKNSAGCQVLKGGWDGVSWKKFLAYCTAAAKTQDGFSYWLLDGKIITPEIGGTPPGVTAETVRETGIS